MRLMNDIAQLLPAALAVQSTGLLVILIVILLRLGDISSSVRRSMTLLDFVLDDNHERSRLMKNVHRDSTFRSPTGDTASQPDVGVISRTASADGSGT